MKGSPVLSFEPRSSRRCTKGGVSICKYLFVKIRVICGYSSCASWFIILGIISRSNKSFKYPIE